MTDLRPSSLRKAAEAIIAKIDAAEAQWRQRQAPHAMHGVATPDELAELDARLIHEGADVRRRIAEALNAQLPTRQTMPGTAPSSTPRMPHPRDLHARQQEMTAAIAARLSALNASAHGADGPSSAPWLDASTCHEWVRIGPGLFRRKADIPGFQEPTYRPYTATYGV